MGALAGAISRAMTTPISVLTTRQQTSTANPKPGLFQTLLSIMRDEGVARLWRGLGPSLVLTVNPAITYGVFQRLRNLLLRLRARRAPTISPPPSLTRLETFLLGAVTKAIATVVTYPYIMAKVRLQWKPPSGVEAAAKGKGREGEGGAEDAEMVRYRDTWDVLRKVWRTDGFVGWYTGMPAQLLKAVLCQGILFVSKDVFTDATVTAFRMVYGMEKVA
ncbi:ADP/ATP carrier protein [Irineochytrium annulatum]|nr:ADP/ATP carrier protein [Irineochytrium annulatum]